MITNSRRHLIATFNIKTQNWISQHLILKNEVSHIKGFIKKDDHERITVWIGYLSDAYKSKHIASNEKAYYVKFIEVFQPIIDDVCATCGRDQCTFLIQSLGYRDAFLSFIRIDLCVLKNMGSMSYVVDLGSFMDQTRLA